MSLTVETLDPSLTLDEVRALHVMDLHTYPIPTTLRFADQNGKVTCWTTSREHHASLLADGVNVLTPKQYASLLARKEETVGELEERTGVRLFSVQLCTVSKGG